VTAAIPRPANRPAVVATLLTGLAIAVAAAVAWLGASKVGIVPAAVGLALLAGFATSGSV